MRRRSFVFIDGGVTSTPTPPAGKSVQVSTSGYWQTLSMPSGWQEYRTTSTGAPSGFLIYSDTTTSAYKIELMTAGLSSREDGKTGGGVWPDNAMITSVNTTSTSTYAVYKLFGLDNGKTYTIDVVGSYGNNWGWYTDYRVNGGGTVQTLLTDNNTSNKKTFANVSPSSGIINVEWKLNSGSNAQINLIIFTEDS